MQLPKEETTAKKMNEFRKRRKIYGGDTTK